MSCSKGILVAATRTRTNNLLRFLTVFLILPVLLLLWGGGAHADGFHLIDFYSPTVKEGWKRLKKHLGFPPLHADKTWSDLGRWETSGEKVGPNKGLTKGLTQGIILHGVTVKMIEVLKYCDDYVPSYANDSPAWMQTEELRKASIGDAKEVIKELGPNVLPRVWEALEEFLRFESHPQKSKIEKLKFCAFFGVFGISIFMVTFVIHYIN